MFNNSGSENKGKREEEKVGLINKSFNGEQKQKKKKEDFAGVSPKDFNTDNFLGNINGLIEPESSSEDEEDEQRIADIKQPSENEQKYRTKGLAINVDESTSLIKTNRVEKTKEKKGFDILIILPFFSGVFSLIGFLIPLIIYVLKNTEQLSFAPPIWLFTVASPSHEIGLVLLSCFTILFSVICYLKYKSLSNIGVNKIINVIVLFIGFGIPFGFMFLIIWNQSQYPVCHEIAGWITLVSIFLYFACWMFFDYYYRVLYQIRLIPTWLMICRTIIYLFLLVNSIILITMIIVFYVDPQLGKNNVFLSINSGFEYTLFFILFPLLQFTCVFDLKTEKRVGRRIFKVNVEK